MVFVFFLQIQFPLNCFSLFFGVLLSFFLVIKVVIICIFVYYIVAFSSSHFFFYEFYFHVLKVRKFVACFYRNYKFSYSAGVEFNNITDSSSFGIFILLLLIIRLYVETLMYCRYCLMCFLLYPVQLLV